MPSSLNRVRKPTRWAEPTPALQLQFAGIEPSLIGQSTLLVSVGNLVDCAVEGLVCYASSSLALHSVVASKLVDVGGASIRAECAKHLPAEIGDAVVLSAGKLAARYILIAVTNHIKSAPTIASIRASVQSVLAQANTLGLTSIALPTIRVSKQISPDDALLASLAPIVDHLSGPTTIKHVVLMIDDPEDFPLLDQYLPVCLDRLRAVGKLRATARALRSAEEALRQTIGHGWSPADCLADIVQQQIAIQQQTLQILHEQQRAIGLRWQESHLREVELTASEINRLSHVLETLEGNTSPTMIAVSS